MSCLVQNKILKFESLKLEDTLVEWITQILAFLNELPAIQDG